MQLQQAYLCLWYGLGYYVHEFSLYFHSFLHNFIRSYLVPMINIQVEKNEQFIALMICHPFPIVCHLVPIHGTKGDNHVWRFHAKNVNFWR